MAKGNWELYFTAIKNQQWEEAKRALQDISKQEKGNANVYLKLGDLYQRTGDSVNAIASYHHSALLLRSQGFLQKAVALYKLMLRIDPDYQEAIEQSRTLLMDIETSKSAKPLPSAAPHEETVEDFAAAIAEKASVAPEIPALLSGMPETDARKLLDSLDIRTYADGQILIEEGDIGDSIYIIRSGKARVIAHLLGKELELAVLSEGDLFGEVGFLTGRPRTASVIADGSLEVFEIGRATLEEIIERNPAILPMIEEFQENRALDTIRKIQDTQ